MDWVPYRAQVCVALFLQATIMLVNGSYVCNGVSLGASMGLLNEDVAICFYITSLGVGLAFPIVGMVRSGLGSKAVFLAALTGQAVLSFFCARAETMPGLLVCSLFLGLLKGFAIIELVGILGPIFSKRGLMMEFYCFFLPINFAVGQAGIMLTTYFAYLHDWRYVYYVGMAMLLVSLALVMLCFRRRHESLKISLKDIDFSGMVLVALFLAAATSALNYGNVFDWFDSPFIRACTGVLPIAAALYFCARKGKKNPYLRHEVLGYRKTLLAHTYMFGVMVLAGSGYLISAYVDQVLHYDALYGNSLNLAMVPAFALAGCFCFWWSRTRPFRFRYLTTVSVLSFAAYAALVYFEVSPEGTFEALILPSLLRGFGMLTAFIAFGSYSVEDIPQNLKSHNAFFFLTVRSTLAAVAGMCLFSKWLEVRALYYVSALSREVDVLNPGAQSVLVDGLQAAAARGVPNAEAVKVALSGLFQTVHEQAVVCAVKEIFGYVLMALLVVAALTALTHFNAVIRARTTRYAA